MNDSSRSKVCKMQNKEIDFIARHYRKGRFDTAVAWSRLGIGAAARRRRLRIAAAIAGLVILSASAGLLIREYNTVTHPQQPQETHVESPMQTVRVIDFDNAPLEKVIETIESVYGVRVIGVPDAAENYSLSLHYEGTPADLIAAINEILGTSMEVVEK